MNRTIKKTVRIFSRLIAMALLTGSVAFAGETSLSGREPVVGLFSAADIAFLAKPAAVDTIPGAGAAASDFAGREPVVGLISTSDVDFASAPYAADALAPEYRGRNATVAETFAGREPLVGLVSAADIAFTTGDWHRRELTSMNKTLVCLPGEPAAAGGWPCVE